MGKSPSTALSRRRFMASAAGAAATAAGSAAFGQSTAMSNSTVIEGEISQSVVRNVSSFRTLNWQDYFSNTAPAAILVDIRSRALHFWNADQSIYRLYPTSVPASEELTRRGECSVTQKVVAPTWRPTPSMLERNPEWPSVVEGGDPTNPLGPFALYLSWQYYRIHGTHDTRKIGRPSSNGCIGLYNEHIAELFELTPVGTQVMLI
ncbi:L,D-transpeptidase [Pseudoroseicyclus sp. H15]